MTVSTIIILKCSWSNKDYVFIDSFCIYVEDNKKFEKSMEDLMDYSNYDVDHKLHDTSRKAELGYFKDEIDCNSKCVEFVGLRSKCYAMKIRNIKEKSYSEKKVCKGLGKMAIKNRLRFDEYKKCLFERKDIRHHYTGIVSQKHNIYSVVRKKKALSCFDSKRWIFNCGLHSVPLGSYLIKKHGNICYNI